MKSMRNIDAILNGIYDGVITYGELKDYGDFGIGVFAEGLHVSGYHLHFITEDRTAGGHVLEFVVKDAKLTVDYTSELHIILPNTEEFNRLDLAMSRKGELEEAEK